MRSKRGVSEIVGYVLLISITFSIAGLVFGWLRFYATPVDEITCEEGVSLTLRSYNYNCDTDKLNLTLQNRGRFDFQGYIIRVNNMSGSKIGIYTLNKTGKPMTTAETYEDVYSSIKIDDGTGSGSTIGGNLYFLEIQPYQIIKGDTIYCKDVVVKQDLVCS